MPYLKAFMLPLMARAGKMIDEEQNEQVVRRVRGGGGGGGGSQ